MNFSNLHYDKQDEEFLILVNRTIEHNREDRALFFSYLHPNGIIDLSTPRELRMASAVINLLDTLDLGKEEERLLALKALHDEVLVSARTSFRLNTGRVLIQIMKEIVRAHGDEKKQIKLAHDFRLAATGKPSIVRKILKRYYFLEMPEEWNQIVFDHHVHDANTKGRKNATHLIMDAWIKGIRSLSVIYYNFVTPEAARELLTAAEIMGISVRIGILFTAPFRGKLVDFIWIPRGFADAGSFLSFLTEPAMRHLCEEGQKASKWLEEHILNTLQRWNQVDRIETSEELNIVINPLSEQEFMEFVGTGQASLLHLAEFIHRYILPPLSQHVQQILARMQEIGEENAEYAPLQKELQFLDTITSESILEHLNLCENAAKEELGDKKNDPPEILRLSPLVLLDWITSLRSGNRVILNLASLTPEEVLTLLWDCQGLITHLELFNLKDWQEGKAIHTKAINDLQQAINEGSAPRLKQIIRAMINRCSDSEVSSEISSDNTENACQDSGVHRSLSATVPLCADRMEKLRVILRNISVLQNFYKKTKLYTRLGTDSTSRPGRRSGMGLAYAQTLPYRAQKELKETTNTSRLRLPLRTELVERISWHIPSAGEHPSLATRIIRCIPGFKHFGLKRERDWLPLNEHTQVCNDGMCTTDTASFPTDQGNIITLGGVGRQGTNGFFPDSIPPMEDPTVKIYYMNTRLSNTLKVLVGFIPAFLTFQRTQDIALLAWFGAPLWFLITGLRNIMQAVLGGGGLRRSPLLRWNNYVSWTRLCESLMYTGLSVVLLELLVRKILLGDVLHINADNNILLTFSIISLVNGFYIAWHNYFRGLQKEAIIGNLFRSIFAIPVSLAYNAALAACLSLLDVQNMSVILLSSSAIISKVASDTVAGIIEGIADRNSNMRLRRWDYSSKLKQTFEIYARLELLFPEQGVLEMLNKPKDLLAALENDHKELRLGLIINALDLMYFWYYQPRAVLALQEQVDKFTGSERLALLRTQKVLTCEKEVSQLFVDGLVGRKFARSLSFYLEHNEQYVTEIEKICLGRRKTRMLSVRKSP